jgi:acyl dehydratase
VRQKGVEPARLDRGKIGRRADRVWVVGRHDVLCSNCAARTKDRAMPPRPAIPDGKTYDEIEIGDSFSVTRMITGADIDRYAEWTQDYNPMHMDDAYAAKTKFGSRVAHGPITLGMIAPVIGMNLPGPGCILMTLNSEFKKPVKPGDTITARAEVIRKFDDKRYIELALRYTNQRGEDVIVGSAKVKPRVAR